MGYSFNAVCGDAYYSANVVRMQLIRGAMLFEDVIPGKVLIEKFASNDPWHVTPQECTYIADALEIYTTDGAVERLQELYAWAEGHIYRCDLDLDSIREWQAFNRECESCGGYIVG